MIESRTEISERHALEWNTFRNDILIPAFQSGDSNEAKLAKTLADTIRITQDGERRAWNFAEGGSVDGTLELAWDDSPAA